MTMKTPDKLYAGVLKYASEYFRYEGKTGAEIEEEVEELKLQNDAFTC